MSKHAAERAPQTVIVVKGSFTVGRCVECGWEAPARRAHASTAQDLVKHLRAEHGYEGKAKHVDPLEVKADGLGRKETEKKVAHKVKARLKKLAKKS